MGAEIALNLLQYGDSIIQSFSVSPPSQSILTLSVTCEPGTGGNWQIMLPGRPGRGGLQSPDPAGQNTEDLLGEEVNGNAFFRSLALNSSQQATAMMTDKERTGREEVRESVREEGRKGGAAAKRRD